MLSLLATALLSAAEAHRPGLARVAVDDEGVAVTLAREDFGDALPPGVAVDPDLAWTEIGARTTVTSAGAACHLAPLGVEEAPPNAVIVRAALSCPGRGPFALSAPWLARHDGFSATVEAWGAPVAVLDGPDATAPLAPSPRYGGVALRFLGLGVEHIATGLDHVAFVLALVFGARTLRDVLIVATGFTVAHSLTLGLAATGLVHAPSSVVEPLIAASIVLVAVENRVARDLSLQRRTATAFGFGLIHGLGFAGALGEIGLPLGARLLSLGVFNLGVELGQAAIVLLTFPVLAKLRPRDPDDRIGLAASAILVLCGLWWLVQRLL